jgi:hypothetical protein
LLLQKLNNIRLKELEEYKEIFGKKNEKSYFIREEQSVLRLNNKFSVIRNYLFDIW